MRSEVVKAKIFTDGFKRRQKLKQRPLANSLKLALGYRLLLNDQFSMLLIKLSGDIEINPGPTSNAVQMSHNNRAVKCLGLNARSLMSVRKTNDGESVSNLERFQNFVYSEDIDIVFVNKTWLSASIHNGEILHSGYTIIRNDRKGRGGGVLLGIKMGFFKSVREIKHSHNLEFVLVELKTVSDSNFLICSCYRPPNADRTWIENFENFLNDVCSYHSKIVLVGDFNFPRASWNSREISTCVHETKFIEILDEFFLEQINSIPTRENNVLDLLITSIPDKINIIEVLKPTDVGIFTDHSLIMFDLIIACKPLPKVKRSVFNYRQADFDGLRAHLQSLNLKEKVSEHGDINKAVVKQFVPTVNLKGRKHLPWMSSTIMHLIRKKNTLRMRIKRSSSPSDYLRNKFKHLRSTVKKILRDGRLKYMNKICTDRDYNLKRFWSFFKTKSKISNIPAKVSTKVNESERMYANNTNDIANMFVQ